MFIYDKNDHLVYVSYKKKRKGRVTEDKKWNFEPIQMISNFGRRNNPYFLVLPDNYPGWMGDYIEHECPNYVKEYYPNEGVVILRENVSSSKTLIYRQYIEHFILNLFTAVFISNDNIDYSQYRDQLLNSIEIVGWNLFNNAEKLKSLHNIKVEYDINNPKMIGAAYFDLLSVADISMDEQVAAFVETLIDDTDYLASGENEAEYVQSILTMDVPDDTAAEDVVIEECDDTVEPENIFTESDNESLEEQTEGAASIEAPVKANEPFSMEILVDAVVLEPVAIDVAVEPVQDELEPVAIDVAVEPVLAELEPVAIDVAVEPVLAELEPVAIDVAVEPVQDELEPVAINVAIEPVLAELEPAAINVAIEPISDTFIKNDNDLDLIMLNSDLIAPPKKVRKVKAKINLGQSTLF